MLIVWRLDPLGRNLWQLAMTLEELSAHGVGVVSVNDGINATTPAVRLQMATLGAIAQFERERIAERVRAGLARAKAQGQRLGRRPHRISDDNLGRVVSLSIRGAAKELGVSPSVLHRLRMSRNPVRTPI